MIIPIHQLRLSFSWSPTVSSWSPPRLSPLAQTEASEPQGPAARAVVDQGFYQSEGEMYEEVRASLLSASASSASAKPPSAFAEAKLVILTDVQKFAAE